MWNLSLYATCGGNRARYGANCNKKRTWFSHLGGVPVLVSALLSPFGPPARILDLLLVRALRLAYDDRILSEYRQVLARPLGSIIGLSPT